MMEKVLLIGIDGVYNYGCEAIVRGTVEILKAVNPKIEVTYASYNFEDDRKRLSDCDIKILPRPKRRRWSWYNIVRKCLSYLHIPYVVPYDKLDWVVGFDTVFSIGGDIYTLASNGSYNASLPLFLEQLQQRGIKYILWGASVGKFEENHLALRFFSHHLSKINLIVSRESNTWEYLQSLNLNANLCLAPDPAFLVKNPVNLVPEQHEGIIIGINLSPLSALYEYGSIEEAVAIQAEAVIRLIERRGGEGLFLPHVLSPDKSDNDLLYMKAIYDKLPKNFQDKIMIIDSDPGFVGLKRFIVKCDYVIAARMHCAINAITVSVPTLFLSYSEKAKGMAEFVYGSKDMVVALGDFENTQLVIERLEKCKFQSRIEEIRDFDYNKIFNR